jgi:hypothetical protein
MMREARVLALRLASVVILTLTRLDDQDEVTEMAVGVESVSSSILHLQSIHPEGICELLLEHRWYAVFFMMGAASGHAFLSS